MLQSPAVFLVERKEDATVEDAPESTVANLGVGGANALEAVIFISFERLL